MRDVFSNEMNWSTYQDKQLSVLVSLERSFNTSLSLSKSVKDNLTMLQSAMTSMISSANALANFVNGLSSSRSGGGRKTSNAKAAREAVEQYKRHIEEAHRIEMENAKNIYEQNMEYLEDQVIAAREELEYALRRKKTQEEYDRDHKAATDYITNKFMQAADYIGKIADNYLAASNNLIKVTGNSGAVVQDARTQIVTSIISELNRDTGNFYSYQDSYAKMVSIANEANVGNIEALKEMTRPILLADETLNANIGSIAQLFNRFYTRYSFSSMEMESIVDEIRGNTAGNSSTAQATLENINKMENLIAIYSEGDKEKMSEMVDSISTYTSYLESMGVDTANITSTMYDIMLGNKEALSPQVLAALDAAGSSFEEAQYLLRNDVDGMEKVVNMFTTGTEDLIGGVIDSAVAGMSLDALGVPKEYLDLYAAFNSEGYKTLEEFIATQKNTPTAAETVEDMYVSGTKQVTNWLEKIFNSVANFQNDVGLGLTDVVKAIGLYFGAKKGIEILGKGFGKSAVGDGVEAATKGGLKSFIGSVGADGAYGTGLLGKAQMGGFYASNGALTGSGAAALGIGTAAGVAAGAAGAYYGISKGAGQLSDDTSSNDKYAGWNIAGGAAMGVGGGALAASLLGAGAAAGPIGWAALAIGGLALVATDAAESLNTFGSSDAVEKAYDEAAEGIRNKAREQEDALLDIRVGINKYEDIVNSSTATEADILLAQKELELQRENLIKSGILSEEEVEKARSANADGLAALTEAYLKATNQWSDGATDILDKYKKDDMAYAKTLQDTIESQLQVWNDGNLLTEGSEELKATDDFMYSLFNSMKDRKASGEEFDADTQLIYEDLLKAYKDGKLSSSEANMIIDEGTWNTTFQNANLGTTELLTAFEKMSYSNSVGKSTYDDIMSDEMKGKTYYGVTGDAAEWMARAAAATTAEGAIAYLDQLREAGYTSSKYTEISEVAKKWGLTGYDVGTNYVTKDQIAILHEGEAVVPKKYNPAANMNELETLREQSDSKQEQSLRNSESANEFLSTLVESIADIREFLSYWREDNIKRETINSAKNKHSSSTRYVSGYMV